MKQFVITFFALLSIFSCKQEAELDGYVINGTAKEIYNGIRVYLQTTNEQGRPVAVDSAIVVDERFKFEGSVENPKMLFLNINSITGNLPVLIENAKITIDIDKQNISQSVVKGSKSHDAYKAYMSGINNLQSEIQSLYIQLDQADIIKNEDQYNFINKKVEEKLEEGRNYTPKFIEDHPNNFASLFILDINLNAKELDIEKFEKAFSQTSDKLRESDYGKILSDKIEMVKETQQKLQRLATGQKAPNFTAPDPDGNPLSLNDIKGKVTIIDFWAAWCGPCRRENPNVVKVYEKYHDKGLEIIGVSLDGTPKQPDAKAAWLKAVEDDKLTWHHVSFLQYFNDPIARLYDINAIPATFIINEEGTIIAKNLRGVALENKISEILD